MNINDFNKMMAESNPNYPIRPQIVNFCGTKYKTYSKLDMMARMISFPTKSVIINK